jgi:hypothetical protein
MSRSGYSDGDCDSNEDMLRMYGWQANVRRCMSGRKGQAFMWQLYLALEALPDRALVTGALVDREGSYCALGAVARFRGMEIPEQFRETEEGEPDEYEFASAMGPFLGVKDMLAREVMYHNDDDDDWHEVPGPPKRYCSLRRSDNPHERWLRMRAWVVEQLRGIP